MTELFKDPRDGEKLGSIQVAGVAAGEQRQAFPLPPEMQPEERLAPFGFAIAWLKNGYKITRKGWNGKNMWLALQVPDAHSKMSLPYIYMRTAQGDLVPWLASQTDVLSEDWVLLPEGTV